ncbi:CPBP family intramembrane glutamic endopeptidase [Granulicoccus sp. GXG6511]|uniref:CPBP family intramembrane glutamic endopeptidase n=1 Tax=Granulicoccus sp. GXG6511 TaxID=3381351 RepID=UPI003D7C7776
MNTSPQVLATPAAHQHMVGRPDAPPPTASAPHEYQQRIAIERPRAWRGIVALVLLMLGMLVFAGIFGVAAVGIEFAVRGEITTGMTPFTLAGGMLGLAAMTPWSMALQKWFFKVPAVSLHSVVARFRWDVFGRSVAILIPLWALVQVVYPSLLPQPTAAYASGDALAFVVITLMLVPLQSMGEEYAFRGLAFRIAASWGRGPRTGLVIGLVVSSLLFMVAHFALDPWLNVYYFTFGAALCLITWRTGGLESAVVLHAVNNVVAFLVGVTLRHDLNAGLDRSAGVASPVMLIPCALLVIVAAIVWWRTPRPALSPPAPGAELAHPTPTGTLAE